MELSVVFQTTNIFSWKKEKLLELQREFLWSFYKYISLLERLRGVVVCGRLVDISEAQ